MRHAWAGPQRATADRAVRSRPAAQAFPMGAVLPPRSIAKTTLVVVLAYVLVLQAVLAFGAAAQHLAGTSTSASTGIICPAHLEDAYLRPDQPVHAEHDDLCCVAH